MQSSTNHQHCPNWTISNNSTVQNELKKKNQHFHTQYISTQIIQYPRIPKWENNNKMTMSIKNFSNTKPKINKLTKEKKEWTHLEVRGGRVWSMLKWVLKKFFLIISLNWWFIFFPMECEEPGWPRRKCHWSSKENFQKWVSRMGFSKTPKNSRTNLTNRCARLDMLSLLPVTPIFPFSNMKSPWKDSLHHAVEMLSPLVLYGWSYKVWRLLKWLSPLMLWLEPQIMKISYYILPSNLYY